MVLVARNQENLDLAVAEITSETGSNAVAISADLSKAGDVAGAAADAVAALGAIDIVVNNAGSAPAGLLDAMSDEAWQDALDLKFMGFVRMARALVPAMRQRKWGRVINMGGRLGHQPRGDNIIGSPGNAAVQNFTVALAKEAAPDNVLVNVINPGPILPTRHKTRVTQRAAAQGVSEAEMEKAPLASVPVGRYGQPEDIAALAAFLCSDRAHFITGTMINVDGGGTRRL